MNYEKTLPDGYIEAKTVDAKNKSFVLKMNLWATAIAIAVIIPGVLFFKDKLDIEAYTLAVSIHLIAMIPLYMVLHELVHGLAYKLLTKEKLTFGLTLSVAYCGVPNIYVYRKAAMISLVAPLVVFTAVFGVMLFALPNIWYRFLSMVMFGIHISGCVGDIYDTVLYLFKFKDPDVLMQDTGPKQTFFVKSN